MSKDSTLKPQTSRSARGSSSQPPQERMPKKLSLIEVRPGLFLNVDHIVSVRVSSQEEGSGSAIVQLSNGDKLSLTLSEFAAISAEEPRPSTRLPQKTALEE
jgi:hypothetical protein